MDPAIPATATDRLQDADGDGLNLIREQVFFTDPNNPDTDGDGTPDGDESNSGGDPTDPSDNGVAPSGDEVVTIRLTVGDPSGSESERYILQVGKVWHQSEDYGDVTSADYKFRLGTEHEVRVIHVGTRPDQPAPDFDYEAAIGRVPQSSEDFHICLDDPEPILGEYYTTGDDFRAQGHLAILTVAALADAQWHHLLPRQFEEFFNEVGILDIHEPQWGLLLEVGDHNQVHPAWNTAWSEFWVNRDPATTTKQEVLDELLELFNDEQFASVYSRGGKPHVRWQTWNGLTDAAKSRAFIILKRSFKLLGIAFAAFGGAEAANAAFAPALALGSQAALHDYNQAVSHLADGNIIPGAKRSLFGVIGAADVSLLTGSPNVDGLVPKMLNAMIQANALSILEARPLYIQAVKDFDEAVANLDLDDCTI